jgi:hypothetical protein
MKKVLMFVLVLGLVTALAGGAAFAVPTFSGLYYRSGPLAGDPYYGLIQIKLSGYSWSTLYPAGTYFDPTGVLYTTGDPNNLTAGATNDLQNTWGLGEDVWAVANITSIVADEGLYANTPVWQPSGDEELVAIVYGLNDFAVTAGGTLGIEERQVGGFIDVHR